MTLSWQKMIGFRGLLISLWFTLFAIFKLRPVYGKEFYDCTQLEEFLEDKDALDSLTKGFEANLHFSETWLQLLVNKNFFESLDYLINKVYNEDSDADVVPVLRRFISKVREKQDQLLDLANGKRKQLTLHPAFQWAQDLNSVALSIKIAHRLDAPSCIDVYDKNVTITETNLTVSCMCKKYDGIHKYYMNHELWDAINVTSSFYEFQSAGRLYVNLTKAEQPKRWRRLLKSEDRPDNMRIWYELYEQIGDLEDHTTFETDDAFEDLVHIERPKKKSGKKKSKKKKKAKKTDDAKEDL